MSRAAQRQERHENQHALRVRSKFGKTMPSTVEPPIVPSDPARCPFYAVGPELVPSPAR